MSDVNAWVLDFGAGLVAAVGELELVHLLPDVPALFEVPQSPAYCRNVLVWQGEVLPLMDLATRLLGGAATEGQRLVAVTAYQEHPGADSRYGALVLNGPPVRTAVADSQSCGLPESQPGWQRLAIACFQHEGCGSVPVLDLARVFSPP